MAIVKHMLNDSSCLDLAFHALADPTRRGFVARLTRAPATVSEWAVSRTVPVEAVPGFVAMTLPTAAIG